MEEERRDPSAVTIRVRLINPRSNSKEIIRHIEMEILRENMGFTLLTASGCASVKSTFTLYLLNLNELLLVF